MLVREPRLLGHAGRREQIAQALPGRGLPRELDDLDRALLGQALEIEVGQAQGHPEPLGERALGQRLALVDGRQDLEIALVLPLHHLFRGSPGDSGCVQQLNRSRVEHGPVKDVKPIHSTRRTAVRVARGAARRMPRLPGCKRPRSRQCADSTGRGHAPDEPAPLALAHRGLPHPRRGDDRLGEHRPPPARVGPRQSPRARAALPSEPRRGPALGGDLRRLRLLPAPGALRGRRPVLRLSRRALDRPGGDAGLPRAGNGGRLRRRPHPVGRPRGAARRVPVRHRALRRVLAAELPARLAARLDRRADPLDPAPHRGLPPPGLDRGARPRGRPRAPDEADVSGLRRGAHRPSGLRGVAGRRAAAAPGAAGPGRRHRGGHRAAVVRAAHRRHAVSGRRPLVQAGRRGRPGRPVLVDVAPVLSARLSAPVRAPRRPRLRVGTLGAQEGSPGPRLSLAGHAAGALRVLDHPEPEPALYPAAPARRRPGRDGGHSLVPHAVAARGRGGPRRRGRAPGVDDHVRHPAASHARRVSHADSCCRTRPCGPTGSSSGSWTS